MPYDDPEPEDPTVLVGVVLPGGEDSMRDMAHAFAEEFAAMGYDEPGLLRLFRDPFYAGAHRAYRALGEPAITAIVRENLEAWGRFRVVVTDTPADEHDSEETLPAPDPLLQIGRLHPADGGRGGDR